MSKHGASNPTEKKVLPIVSTCPACPHHIPHVSTECPLEKENASLGSTQDKVSKYLPPHMRLNKENESVEHMPVAIPDPSNVMQVETPKERLVVPLPQAKESPFYEQFDVCNPILGNISRSRLVPQLKSQS